MYYKVRITQTGKERFSKDDYRTFDRESHSFATKAEALAFLEERYPACKRVKMYADRADGVADQVGWIYCYLNSDISHDSATWTQQDWVELTEVQEVPVTW